ncbi:MCE family protein [Aeromicrobium ginsengisoli]|uniref:MCE family protein n=1 Tax=Aeromicrobium ginsengisoli TaxID=363867 RepID=A0A5M4F8Y4_9ACTN|nr:MlaD family protein [Aeromicrobium ginsengisoli]KAA1394240.1 MCE family protein [Aeromicrobium ginsengisoli]
MKQLVHRDDVRRLGIGAVAIVIGLAIAYVGTVVQTGGQLPLRSYTTVTADFDDVGTLKPQQKVTENGVRVGLVTDVTYKRGGGARVTMRLDGDHAIYRDAAAVVGNESALGRKFVDIDRGTKATGRLGDDVISEKVTSSASDLNTVLESFTPPAREGLRTLLTNLGGGMIGHGEDLHVAIERSPKILDNAQTVLDAVNSQEADLPQLLDTADRLVTSLARHDEQLASLVDDTATTFEAVNVQDTQALRDTLDELPSTLSTTRKGLSEINPALEDTARAARTLRPGVESLVAATPDLRGFLTESPPVAKVVVTFATDSAEPVASLVPAAKKIRPLVVERLDKTFSDGGPLIGELYQYVPNIGGLASEYRLLSGKFSSDKHYFSAQVALPGLYNVSPPIIGDPLADVDPYPGGYMAAWGGSKGLLP